MRTTVILSCIVFILGLSQPSKAQTEVMAWGNLTGIRVEGQLMEFETSLMVAGSNWTNVNATGKERQRPRYQREGDTQSVQTDLGGVQFAQQVKENGRGSAKVSLSATAKADTTLQGVYFCMDLPARYYANATFRLNGSKTLQVSDLSDKSYSVTSLRIESEKRQIELGFDAKSQIILRKLPDDSGVQVLVLLMGPKLVKNKTVQKEIVITASGQIDHSPALITIDANSPGRLFVGFGGNFRLQNPKADPQVIDYCLDNMRVAYGRVEMPWQLWHPNENTDPIAEAKSGKLNDHVHKSMLMAQKLAKLGMPVIVSDWQAPAWAIQRDRRDPGMYRSGYALNSQKRDQIYKSIADYLVYLKQNYGVEADMFSFNESDLGINVFHTPQEHADFIKGFGAYMASRGLATRMLLGDNSDATTFDFILPAMNNPETHKYIGAVSFHSWRGCDDATLKKWAGAAQQLNVPLIIGEGSTDAAAHSYAQIFYEQTFALYEINLYVRLCAVCQPLSILQWQLTSDYSLLKGDGIYGTQGALAPTRRFWNVKQLASTPENAFSLPTACNKEEINCASFGNIARGEYAIHMVNNGAERETTIKGIPQGVSAFDVYVTDENRGMEKVQEVSVVNGSVVVKLPPASFATFISKKGQLNAAIPVTKNASPEAKALLNFMFDMYGKKTLSGQMWAPWGINEIETVYQITGKYPAIRGHDLIHENQNANEIALATEWWKKGGIPTIMWHWGAPTKGEGYEQSKMKIDIDRCFQEGTEENKAMWADLKRIADHLTVLRDAHVPVLWRPMHEFEGGWFWYGMGTGEQFVKLWRTMFTYFSEERGLNNLIWVLCHCGEPKAEFNPGKAYYDMAGADSYGKGIQQEMFTTIERIHGKVAPIPYHECGTIPDPDESFAKGVTWSWWMLWHTSHLSRYDKAELKRIYDHELIVTLDEMPKIMSY